MPKRKIKLSYEHLKLKGLLTKSELLVLDVNLDIKKEWIDEICEFLKNIPCNTDRWQVLNMCGNLSRLHIDMFDDKDYILKILNNIIEMYNFDDLITCSRVLDYCIIGAFICNITTNNSQIIKYCDSIFKLKEKIPCDCSGYKLVLEKVIIPYCSLPIVILPDENKIEKLKLLKSITDDSKFYYGILRIASEQGDVEKYEKELSNDMNYIVKDKQMMTAVGLYYEKKFDKAEELFKTLINCGIEDVENASKVNLSFMVRRGETKIEKNKFIEIISSTTHKSGLKYMNIALYFHQIDDIGNELYVDAIKELSNLKSDFLDEVITCWGNIQLVGEEEHKIAKDILNTIGIQL